MRDTFGKKALNSLAHANIIISLGTVGLIYMSTSLLSLSSADILMYIILFLAGFFIYSVNRFTDISEDEINSPKRTEFVKKRYRFFLIGSVSSLIVALALAVMHSFMTFLIVLIPVIFVLVYSLNWKLKHNLKHKRLKERFFIKNFIVALGWAIIPFYAAVYNNSFSLGVLFISAFIFLRIFIGAIMFDIRDILGDKARNIQTIPTKYKEENVKKILIILNFLSLLSLLVPFLISLLPADGILIGLFGLFMGFLYINLFGRKFDIRFLCDVIVDGEYVLLGVVTFLIAMLL